MEKVLNMQLTGTYNLVEWGNVTKIFEYDDTDDTDTRNLEYALYSNRDNDNIVLLCKVRYEGEEPDNLDIVLNTLSDEFIANVCETLNSKKDVAAYIYQVSGTTSDVFLFDRSIGNGFCDSASDIVSVADNREHKEKYVDITK